MGYDLAGENRRRRGVMESMTARCPDCSQEFTLSPAMPDGSTQCPHCAGGSQARSTAGTISSQAPGSPLAFLSVWLSRLLKATGVRRAEEFSWRETFSEVFS